MFIPYIDGATIYLKQGDTDEFIPSHDGWENIVQRLIFITRTMLMTDEKNHLIVNKVYDANGQVKSE
jgi:hypothetical protein